MFPGNYCKKVSPATNCINFIRGCDCHCFLSFALSVATRIVIILPGTTSALHCSFCNERQENRSSEQYTQYETQVEKVDEKESRGDERMKRSNDDDKNDAINEFSSNNFNPSNFKVFLTRRGTNLIERLTRNFDL